MFTPFIKLIKTEDPRHSRKTIYYLSVTDDRFSITYVNSVGAYTRYRKYEVKLTINIEPEKVKQRLTEVLPPIYYQIRNQRRVPILTKIALIYIASMYKTPLYKLVKSVTLSEEIGIERELSVNAFVKQAYKLASRLGIVI